jgi:hypothetical protein
VAVDALRHLPKQRFGGVARGLFGFAGSAKGGLGGLEVAQFGLEVVAGVGQRRQVGGDQSEGRQVRVQHRNEVIHPRQKLGVVRWNVSCHSASPRKRISSSLRVFLSNGD